MGQISESVDYLHGEIDSIWGELDSVLVYDEAMEFDEKEFKELVKVFNQTTKLIGNGTDEWPEIAENFGTFCALMILIFRDWPRYSKNDLRDAVEAIGKVSTALETYGVV